ncbi:MAG: transporter substrate-binding domain-containing protein [Clostridia bacterium]|nr:transporter substrate-binding domain-containing protein [Clostridia bacterium]
MKKTIALFLTLALLLCGVSALAEEGDLLSQIQARGTLIIGTEGNWSPWTYHDMETGELTGFDVEIGTLIAHGLGVEPEFMEAAWDSLLTGVDAKRFDIVCNGVGYTEARAEKYTFSTPYVYTHKVLVVRGDNEDIKTIDDLNGRTTANSASSTYAAIAEEHGATVTYVDTLGETVQMLEQGRVDATVNAEGSIDDYLREHPDANIKIVQYLEGDPVAYPIRKGDDTQTLIDAINEILEAARQDGTLAELSVKYFGKDLTAAE